MEPHGKPTDAYRILFPVGIVLGTAGVSIWPLYHYGVTEGYSGRAHAFVQTSGFLYAFIAGFLLTAIPRFTGTAAPSRPVQWTLAAMIALSAVAAELHCFAVAESTFVVAHLLVMALAISRFVRRQRQPPETFPLVGLGMLAGALGALLVAGVSLSVVAPVWYALGRSLLTEGMVLLLVLGVGGFLGPRLLGFAALPSFVTVSATAAPTATATGPLSYAVAGVTLLLSLIAEHGFAVAGHGVPARRRCERRHHDDRAAVAPSRGAHDSGLVRVDRRVARRPLALAGLRSAPAYRVDLLHVMFIGGFTLLILAVATRVTLSHGGHDPARERRSWPLRIGLATGLVALLTRVGAPFAPDSLFRASRVGRAAVDRRHLFWGFFLFRLIRKRGSLHENLPRS